MEETPPQAHTHHKSGFNLLPIILIGLLIFVMFRVDLKTVFESEQLKKNITYIKTTFRDYTTKAGNTFFKTPPTNSGGGESSSFDFKSFFKMPSVSVPQDSQNMNTSDEPTTRTEYPSMQ